MTDTVYVDTVTLLTADSMNEINNAVYHSTSVAKVTVASATTPDIFGAYSNTIDYTGTATCTGFVAAARAGMQRRLICAGACLFTAGANLLIEGIPSGTTITLAANAIVDVTAITTTQFKMTYSVSGTFTAGCTGLTTSPTVTATYSHENGIVILSIPSGLTGTSNVNTFTITGLPATITPTKIVLCSIVEGQNNSVNVYVSPYFNPGSSLILYNGFRGNAWTTSGTKSVDTSEFRYRIG